MHSLIEGCIRETNETTYLVHLENRTCGCHSFQDQDSPCSHAIAAIYATHQAPIDFMPIYLRRATYIEMYEQNLPPISLADMDIQDGNQSTAPLTRIQKGRPRKQRVRAGEVGIPPVCGTCGEAGHNARSCRRPHM